MEKKIDNMSLLTRTYQHINGIGIKKESQLWNEGALDWEYTLDNIDYFAMPKSIRDSLKEELPKSIRLFNEKNYNYFLHKLPELSAYRVYPYLTDKTVFLDIETTGIKPSDSYVTVIGCYDGKETKVFVHGRDEEDFLEYIKRFSIIVTFNGSCFDVPFLERYFATRIRQVQIDLRFVLKDLGYTGGLKKIEHEVGLSRGTDMNGVNGFTAVLLWNYYKDTKDETALDTLIHYNLLDTINLEYLLCFAYNKYVERYNAEDSLIAFKELPSVDEYKCNIDLIRYLHRHSYKYGPKAI